MKRLMMSVAFMLVATMGFAQNPGEKGMSFDQLNRYLGLKGEQVEKVATIHSYFEKQLGGVVNSETMFNNAKQKDADNALLSNLKLMKKVLDDDQYRKYVALIKVTSENSKVNAGNNALLDSYLAENK